MTKPRIFVSAGRTWKPEQEEFLLAVEDLLRVRGLDPCTVDRNDFAAESPAERVRKMMSASAGVLIIAYERTTIVQGVTRQGNDTEVSLDGARLTTVWNQIEAGMAFALGKDVLVIKESGLREEGLLEKITGWYILDTQISSSEIKQRRFEGVLADWIERVKKQATPSAPATSRLPRLDPEGVSISALLRSLSVTQAWTAGGAIFAALGSIAYVAYRLGVLQVFEVSTK